MGIFYPKVQLRLLPAMLGYALAGALVAGLYGVVHDQITYSISSEYFTRLKFLQFQYADFGLSPRFFVAEIGFLATWWVGFIAGWFLARVAVPAFPLAEARSRILRGFVIILACGLLGSLLGLGLGFVRAPDADFSGWQEYASQRGIVDLQSFVRVAYIHNASYLGGLIGLIIALVNLRQLKRRSNKAGGKSCGEAVLPLN
jgi:hypothetical protein